MTMIMNSIDKKAENSNDCHPQWLLSESHWNLATFTCSTQPMSGSNPCPTLNAITLFCLRTV